MLAFAGASEEHHYRSKRGIASFFKRIWPIRKNKVRLPFFPLNSNSTFKPLLSKF